MAMLKIILSHGTAFGFSPPGSITLDFTRWFDHISADSCGPLLDHSIILIHFPKKEKFENSQFLKSWNSSENLKNVWEIFHYFFFKIFIENEWLWPKNNYYLVIRIGCTMVEGLLWILKFNEFFSFCKNKIRNRKVRVVCHLVLWLEQTSVVLARKPNQTNIV